jgi:uncharacterized membrane protein YsdA (DUF1294 family)/cold shock CspA family protein
MRFDGTLKSWNDERGFGFIEPALGGQEIFVHIKSLPSGSGRPTIGLPMSFEVEVGPNGKKRAKAVQFARQSNRLAPERRESPAPWTVPRLLVIPAFALLYWYVAIRFSFMPGTAIAYLVVSGITFITYALDKSAAIQGRWRISESKLHLLGLACGWPGALLAQQLLRHKTSKPSFVSTFWATVLLNLAGLYAAHSSMASGLGL